MENCYIDTGRFLISAVRKKGGGSKKEGKKSAMGNDNLSTKAEQKLTSLK